MRKLALWKGELAALAGDPNSVLSIHLGQLTGDPKLLVTQNTHIHNTYGHTHIHQPINKYKVNLNSTSSEQTMFPSLFVFLNTESFKPLF